MKIKKCIRCGRETTGTYNLKGVKLPLCPVCYNELYGNVLKQKKEGER